MIEKQIMDITNILSTIDISIFFHIRVHKDNSFFVLSNNKLIDKYFFDRLEINKFFLDLMDNSNIGRISTSFWPDPNSISNDEFINFLFNLKFGYGLTIVTPFDHYVDIFSFATDIKNHKINNFYLNNKHLFTRFIIYYRIKANNLIIHAQNNLLHILQNKKKWNIKGANTVLSNIIEKPTKGFIESNNMLIKLDEQEIIYIIDLLEGKSLRDISLLYNIPVSKVKYIVDNIKLKTNSITKTDLLKSFLHNRNYQPSIYERYIKHRRN